jgi:hypothetical protein
MTLKYCGRPSTTTTIGLIGISNSRVCRRVRPMPFRSGHSYRSHSPPSFECAGFLSPNARGYDGAQSGSSWHVLALILARSSAVAWLLAIEAVAKGLCDRGRHAGAVAMPIHAAISAMPQSPPSKHGLANQRRRCQDLCVHQPQSRAYSQVQSAPAMLPSLS